MLDNESGSTHQHCCWQRYFGCVPTTLQAGWLRLLNPETAPKEGADFLACSHFIVFLRQNCENFGGFGQMQEMRVKQGQVGVRSGEHPSRRCSRSSDLGGGESPGQRKRRPGARLLPPTPSLPVPPPEASQQVPWQGGEARETLSGRLSVPGVRRNSPRVFAGNREDLCLPRDDRCA